MLQLLLTVGLVVFCFVSGLFVMSVLIKRNDIADIAWGVGIVLVSVVSYVSLEETTLLSNVLLLLSVLWGLRLSLRILLRNIQKSEDARYKKWRDEWGSWFYVRSYFQVYLLQGFLMLVVGYPFIHASLYGANFVWNSLFVAGLIGWCIGYLFEVVGDYQLDSFLKDKGNRGKIMNRGLWNYSRHPNYFGEVSMWWGVWLLVATLPYGFFALASPLMITFLILKVSGIPMLEQQFAVSPDFQAYKKRTNAFFPWLPKARTSE